MPMLHALKTCVLQLSSEELVYHLENDVVPAITEVCGANAENDVKASEFGEPLPFHELLASSSRVSSRAYTEKRA